MTAPQHKTDSAGVEWVYRDRDALRPADARTAARSGDHTSGARNAPHTPAKPIYGTTDYSDTTRRADRAATDQDGRPIPHYINAVHGFRLNDLSQLPAYDKFRQALAELVEQSDADLSRFLADLRNCALTSVLPAECPACGIWSHPIGGRLVERGFGFEGNYRCGCGNQFRTRHDLTAIRWPDRDEPGSVQDRRGTRDPRPDSADRADRARGTDNSHGSTNR